MRRALTPAARFLWLVAGWQSAALAGYALLPSVLIDNPGAGATGAPFLFWGQQFSAQYGHDGVLFRAGPASLQVAFKNRSRFATLSSAGAGPGRLNVMRGRDPAGWATDLPTYSGLVYAGLYPGIDMRWVLTDQVLESQFIVAPGSDATAIRLQYSGRVRMRVEASGDLLLEVPGGAFREHAPEAYALRGAVRTPVKARFRITGPREVSFEIGKYDRSSTLVIDPTLSYSTLLGGSGHSSATSVAADAAGNVYVAGWTESLNFPVTGGLARGSGIDAFVAKFTAANTLAYCTYIGGSGNDQATGIAVDGSGDAVVVGSTTSTDLPMVSPLQGSLRGSRDAFVARLNSAGTALLFSTYLGGSGSDDAAAVALDSSGSIYVTGDTTSVDFPVAGAFQPHLAGQQNGYVTKLSSTGHALAYSTYLGGSNTDTAAAIAVDPAGNAYIAGTTLSSNFPVKAPIISTIPGQESGFVAKLNSTGSALVYSTYLGGSGGTTITPEGATGIAVDNTGAAYVTGVTSSTDFPVVNAYQASSPGGTHAFVAALNPAGGSLAFSTYFRGSSRDLATSIAVNGALYVGGYTASTNFPVLNAVQSANAGIYDAFFARFTTNGTLVHSSYLGGNNIDSTDAIAVDQFGSIILAGHTLSSNFPLVSPFQSANNSNYSAFLAKVSDTSGCTFAVSPPSIAVASSASAGSVNVSEAGTCYWSASSNANWIIVTSGAAGAGSGTVGFSVAANTTGTARSGSLTIAAQPVAISQQGAAVRGDFDGNGVPDLLWQNQTSGAVTVNYYTANPLAIAGWNWLNTGVVGWRVVAAADFDGNGVPDLVWLNNSTGQAVVDYYGGPGGSTLSGLGSVGDGSGRVVCRRGGGLRRQWRAGSRLAKPNHPTGDRKLLRNRERATRLERLELAAVCRGPRLACSGRRGFRRQWRARSRLGERCDRSNRGRFLQRSGGSHAYWVGVALREQHDRMASRRIQ